MHKIIVNYSGHFLCQEAQQTLESTYDKIIHCEPINFDFDGNVDEQLKLITSSTPELSDANSVIAIIPPGQSTLSILLVSYLHGMIGYFPKICFLELGEDGLYIPKKEYEINVQNVRVAGRIFRVSNFEK